LEADVAKRGGTRSSGATAKPAAKNPGRRPPIAPPPNEAEVADVLVRPLACDDGPLVVRLFGDTGACGGCWCMYWHLPGGKTWDARKGEPNRQALLARIRAGTVKGTLAIAAGEAVGWCHFGPKGSFDRLGRSRVLATEDDPHLWSVVCFFVHRHWRRRGIAERLLAAATEEAFRQGARRVEGYPAKPLAGGGFAATFAYTGVAGMYRAAGYRALRRPPDARAIWVADRPVPRRPVPARPGRSRPGRSEPDRD